MRKRQSRRTRGSAKASANVSCAGPPDKLYASDKEEELHRENIAECVPVKKEANLPKFSMVSIILYIFKDSNRIVALATIALAITSILSMQAMGDVERRQLRAYVALEGINLRTPNLLVPSYSPPADGPGIVFQDYVVPKIKNYGATPASNVNVYLYWYSFPLHQRPPLDFPFNDVPNQYRYSSTISNFTISPGQEVGSSVVPIRNLEPFVEAERELRTLYFHGHVDYGDIYQRRWRNEFCFEYQPFNPVDQKFVPCGSHNGEFQLK